MSSPSTAWEPSKQDLIQVIKILRDSKSPDTNVQRSVQENLIQMSSMPQFNKCLLFVFRKGVSEIDEYTRSMAGLILKNNISKNYENLPIEFIEELKVTLLQCLIDPSRMVRSCAGNIICKISTNDENFCLFVLPHLFQIIEGVDIETARSAFDVLLHICEDISEVVENKPPNNKSVISEIVLHLLRYFDHPNQEYCYLSLKCISRFLSLHFAEVLDPDIQFFENLFKILRRDYQKLHSLICVSMVTITDVAFKFLKPYLSSIIPFMVERTSDSNYNVSLDATEFWISLCDHSEAKELLASALPSLVPIIISHMRYSQADSILRDYEESDFAVDDLPEDIDPSLKSRKHNPSGVSPNESDDCIESDGCSPDWTLRKCSAFTLDRFAYIFGVEIFQYMGNVNTMLQSPDWLNQEAAVLAIGAISDGCSAQAHTYFMPSFPFLLNLLKHKIALVRSITFWTISKYCTVLRNLNDGTLEKTVYYICEGMNDCNKFTQRGAVTSLITILDHCGGQMSSCLDAIFRQVLISLGRFKLKNMISLYDMISVLVSQVPGAVDSDIFRHNILPLLIDRSKYLDKNTSIPTLNLFECLIAIVIEMKQKFYPYSDNFASIVCGLLEQGINQFMAASQHPYQVNFPNEDYIICSLDAISGLIEGLGALAKEFLTRYSAINSFVTCLMSSSPDIRQSAFACIGELCNDCFDLIQPNISNFINLLCNFHQTDTPSTLNNAIWAMGKVAGKLGAECAMYIPYIVPKYTEIISGRNATKYLIENTIICFSIFSTSCPTDMVTFLPLLVIPWTRCLYKMKQSIEKEGCAFSLCRLISINIASVSQNLDCVFEAFVSFTNPSNELRARFSAIINEYSKQFSPQDWNMMMSRIPNSVRGRLHTLYSI